MPNKTKYLVQLFLSVIPIVVVPYAISETKLNTGEEKYIEAVNVGNYYIAAKMLHYPEEFNYVDVQKEACIISDSLRIIVEELGVVEEYQLGGHGKFVSVFVMAGSLDYWSNKMSGLSRTYRVTFSKKGSGYLFFRYAKIDINYVLRAVEYGLFDESKASSETISSIAKRLITEPDRSGVIKETCK